MFKDLCRCSNDTEAKEAAAFYKSVFKDSKITGLGKGAGSLP
jgi:predicted 3-demethylubiquinone-9 3-methyltransferase (glyoxalase superfamily)